MNWGTKIVLLYSGFVIMILGLVFGTMNQKVDLVASDYYEQELKYQHKIDALGNAQELDASIEIEAANKQVSVSFPKTNFDPTIQGEINFYRPSDSDMDVKVPLSINENGQQLISSEKFKRGLYTAQIKWSVNGKNYFVEKSIFMN